MKRLIIAAACAASLSLHTSSAQDAPATSESPAAEPEAAPAAEATPAATVEIKDPVAVVNGVAIRKAELDQAFNTVLATQGVTADVLSEDQKLEGYRQILNDMIIDQLLGEKSKEVAVEESEIQEALKEVQGQFGTTEEFETALSTSGESLESVTSEIKSNLQKRKWIEERVADTEKVEEAEVQTYYNENPERFAAPETVRASHILLSIDAEATPEVVTAKEAEIKALQKQIEEGADFAELAKEHSDDPGSKVNGGDLDFFSKDRMVPEFAEAAFALQPGELSDPVRTQFGYHLIKVTDRREARTIPFDEVKERITDFLNERKEREAVTTLLDALKTQSDVKINLPEAS